jgi:archaeosine synthase
MVSMNLISAESIRRPEVRRWHKRIVERYTPPPGIGLSILLPCSAKKPYSKSKSHMAFRGQIRSAAKAKYPLVHEVILTSPLGLVPRELEDVYPAAHYDVPVTGVWSSEEKEISINLLKEYLRKTESPVIGHVKREYEEICVECGVKTTSGHVGGLERSVSESLRGKKVASPLNERLRRVRAVCDFQFGTTAQEHLFKERIFLKGFQIYDASPIWKVHC